MRSASKNAHSGMARLIFLTSLLSIGSVCAQTPSYKMTTPIPPNLVTPDQTEIRIGTLRFTDGFPDKDTVQKVYDNLDFQRGVDVFLNAQSAPSLLMNIEGMRSIGIDSETAGIFEGQVDSKTLALTPNTQTVSLSAHADLRDGPVVVEIPPNVLGLADDAWMRYIVDMGMVGPDKGKGGKFLLIPPGYKGAIPDGYFAAHSRTYSVWLSIRGFTVKGDSAPAVAAFKKDFRIYPLAQATNPPKNEIHQHVGEVPQQHPG